MVQGSPRTGAREVFLNSMNTPRLLSPQTLFHFTKTKEALFGILESNFRVTYSHERVAGKTKERDFGCPMVSFCDLRLSEAHNHMETYGGYGIGMSKEWANSKGLNTVYYVNKDANLIDQYIDAIDLLYNQLCIEIDASLHDHSKEHRQRIARIESSYQHFFEFFRYMKNYQGTLKRRGKPEVEDFRFAEEREWRYVPPIEDIASFLGHVVPPEKMINPAEKRRLNDYFSDRPLMFRPNDIRYIIVATEDERDETLHHIQMAKAKYAPSDVQRLRSRILTAEQIGNDI